MTLIHRNFAGAERPFELRLGEVLDLQDARGKEGIGAIFMRLASHQYAVEDVTHTIRLGLIGGGMEAGEAKRLVEARVGVQPLYELYALASDILSALMEGIDDDEDEGDNDGDPETPLDAGQIFYAMLQNGLSPQLVRNMRFSDFMAIVKASGAKGEKPPSEAEFEAMLEKARADGYKV